MQSQSKSNAVRNTLSSSVVYSPLRAFAGLLQIAGTALFICSVVASRSALSELPNPLALGISAGTIGGCAYQGLFLALELSCSKMC